VLVVVAIAVVVTTWVVVLVEVGVVVTTSPVVDVESPLSDAHADRTSVSATNPASSVMLRLMD
jgi:hypothetical protein